MKTKNQNKFKDKIKNFFTIPEEVFEEEPSPEFEHQKLFTLTKNKLFVGVLLFLLLVDVLVFFNLNQFYIRAALGFLFIVTVPGLLIMLMLKIREIGFWEYLVYTVGLSISFIMFAGLTVNWILPWLNITDKPLSLYPILICFNLFLLIFWLVAYIRNQDFKGFDITIPKLDLINNIFFIVPMLFPVLSILGAFILNNHGTNILTMIMLGGIAVYVLLLTIFRKKLNKNIYPWSLYFIGLSLLLSLSMRSWFVSGWDVFQEELVFNLTLKNFSWDISYLRDAYNACLSITILPTIFYSIIHVKNTIIFKLFFQIIFAIIPIIIYLITQKYFSRVISFLSAFVFTSPLGYIYMAVLPRQEIAFIFFGLLLLTLFTKNLFFIPKKMLFILFGVAMILSHYSTSYIGLSLIFFAYLISLCYRKNEKVKRNICLSGFLVFLLLLFGFLWYSQLTNTSSGLFNVFEDSARNFQEIFSNELKAEGSSISDQFNPSYKSKENTDKLIKYINETQIKYSLGKKFNLYPNDSTKNYVPIIISSRFNPSKISYSLLSKVYFSGRLINILVKLFILFGLVTIILNRSKVFNFEYSLFSIILGIFVALLISVPLLSIKYSLGRGYQQSLFLLSFSCILGGLFFLKIINKQLRFPFLALILGLLLIFSTGFIPSLTGGVESNINLENLGVSYNQAYSHKMEIESAKWISSRLNGELIYAGEYAKKRLFKSLIYEPVIDDIFPSILDKNSYVFLDYSNKKENIVYKSYEGVYLSFNYPSFFLTKNKNKIYNNGGSEIYK